jgi:hypothetical protein
MRRLQLILKCTCALAFAVGMVLTSAYAAQFKQGLFVCWNNTGGSKCTALASQQCLFQGGGGCWYCSGNGVLYTDTCIAANNGGGCAITGKTMNCGNQFSGNCQNNNGQWSCGNLNPAPQPCSTVYQCP